MGFESWIVLFVFKPKPHAFLYYTRPTSRRHISVAVHKENFDVSIEMLCNTTVYIDRHVVGEAIITMPCHS